LAPSGKTTVLHTFTGGPDGGFPVRHADEIAVVECGFDEYLRLGKTVWSEIVIRQSASLIGVIEKDHRPGARLEIGRFDQF
jgi:hypothetical protein